MKLKKRYKIEKIIYELTLLLPSYSYMLEQYNHALKESTQKESKISEKNRKILNETNVLLEKMRVQIVKYRKYHKKTVKIVNDAFDTFDTSNISVFMIGLNLLLMHSSIENQKIFISSTSDIIDFEENILNNIDLKGSNTEKAFETAEKYSELVKKKIFPF